MLKKIYKGSLDELETISRNDQNAWNEIEASEDVSEFVEFVEKTGLVAYQPDADQKLAKVNFSKLSLFKTFNVLKDLGLDRDTFYNLNSLGLRSDEFITKHDGLHVLFAGCSITAGEGIPVEYTWPNLVHQYISKNEKTSGYFNVAKPGATMIDIITQIRQYINLYGKPDVLFFNIPDFEREHKIIYKDKDTSEIMSEILKLQLGYGVYELFSRYCDANGIKLFSFTWDHPDETIWDYPFNPIMDFSNLYMYAARDRDEYFFKYHDVDMPYPEYRYTAFDGAHPGFAAHAFYADFIYKKYENWKRNDKKN
jgi:hypothetical protein